MWNRFDIGKHFTETKKTQKTDLLEIHMKNSKTLLLTLLLFSLPLLGCASPKNKEVPQLPAFISFSGQTENAKATVDGVEFVLDESFLRTNRYQLSAGKHSVIVSNGQEVIVNRFFYLPGGVVKDIKIPFPDL